MNMNDLAEMAAEKQNIQQINQCQRNTESMVHNANDTYDDSQDLKTPTAENQQTLIEPKVFSSLHSLNIFQFFLYFETSLPINVLNFSLPSF